ncbi:hypothetical protein [Desulfobulbus sp.]|uniref:hypothetical protein n=1 Tax=Desulfobulbus sp. TaxID=895 RepID=UPI00286F3783|nr:hypothetical protein [Desulfobulbus sp.]
MLFATPRQVMRARASALRKMRQRIETRVKRQAAKELRMPQKAISGRFFSDPVRTGDSVLKVWIGTDPVSPFRLGAVGVYGEPGRPFSGVMVGKRKYVGAFLASIYTGRQKVWIRLRSKFFSPELYPTKRRPGDRGLSDDPRLKHRFPVIRAAVPVDAVFEKVVERDLDAISQDFQKVFAQDLNYFTNVRGKQ